MLNKNEVNKLEDYQLFQLLQNVSLDKHLKCSLKAELDSRNLPPVKSAELLKRYSDEIGKMDRAIGVVGNPMYSPFYLKRHFAYLAILQTQGKKQEARKYTWRIITGFIVYYAVISLIFILFQMYS